eukprot:2557524-Rhodomonas_salina.2
MESRGQVQIVDFCRRCRGWRVCGWSWDRGMPVHPRAYDALSQQQNNRRSLTFSVIANDVANHPDQTQSEGAGDRDKTGMIVTVSYTHLRAHETEADL